MESSVVGGVVDVVKTCLEIVALVVAGIWAYYKWRESNELSRQINMEVTAEEHPINDKSSVLVIRIVLNNVGYRSLIPGTKGLEVSVKRLFAGGDGPRLEWSKGQLVLDEVDILAHYKEEGAADYEDAFRLDRNGTYHETCALTIERGHVYLVQAALWLAEDDDQIEYCYHASTDPCVHSAGIAQLPL